jgi:hypothetical protein
MTTASSSTTNDVATSTELDVAFIIDATGSMGSYIQSAQEVCMRYVKPIYEKYVFCRICEISFEILLSVKNVH